MIKGRTDEEGEILTSNSGNRNELDEPSDSKDSDGKDDKTTDESELSRNDLGSPFSRVGGEHCERREGREESRDQPSSASNFSSLSS